MADYSDPNTPLTAAGYAWSATLARGPLQRGANDSHDCTGSYTTQPGATVGDLRAGITGWYAQTYGVPVEAVVIVRLSLREK